MRKLLVISVMAMLVGASSIWLMQRDSGYILLSINDVTVEMTAWVGLLLYLLLTGITVWLILLLNGCLRPVVFGSGGRQEKVIGTLIKQRKDLFFLSTMIGKKPVRCWQIRLLSHQCRMSIYCLRLELPPKTIK